ncbi:hypothetical protein K435DRAFT_800982 [Dendrothele bispora CBS 962.96]|uniref:Uncharacterized protein n=1 Tax=Dendrothele bispora (strain CBS 962.96) TaxID=1314807 RepID=A0A4S8LQV5_DENBC|nr:hypothetical protein K435DRAFT_800982 [Dendrothele bispora CBS 962.96]
MSDPVYQYRLPSPDTVYQYRLSSPNMVYQYPLPRPDTVYQYPLPSPDTEPKSILNVIWHLIPTPPFFDLRSRTSNLSKADQPVLDDTLNQLQLTFDSLTIDQSLVPSYVESPATAELSLSSNVPMSGPTFHFRLIQLQLASQWSLPKSTNQSTMTLDPVYQYQSPSPDLVYQYQLPSPDPVYQYRLSSWY